MQMMTRSLTDVAPPEEAEDQHFTGDLNMQEASYAASFISVPCWKPAVKVSSSQSAH